MFLNPDSIVALEAASKTIDTVSLAEFGSFTVEWHALTARTHDVTFGLLADNMINTLNKEYPKQVWQALVTFPMLSSSNSVFYLHQGTAESSAEFPIGGPLASALLQGGKSDARVSIFRPFCPRGSTDILGDISKATHIQ
jgi:hypothetical protein